MKTILCLIGLVFCFGCFTPQHVNYLRTKQRAQAIKVSARNNTVYAGIDILSVRDALEVDPGGTSWALTKDSLLVIGGGLLGKYAIDEIKESSDSDKPDAIPIPRVQAETVVVNQGSGALNYSADVSEGE